MSRVTDTPSHAHAVAWLRDLLTQCGEGADAVLTEVLADRDVRALRVVGPLTEDSVRYSFVEPVGYVAPLRTVGDGGWFWYLTDAAHDTPPDQRTEGIAPTRAAADRALCLALRALGWSPVEVPTEEAVEAEAPAAPPADAPRTRAGSYPDPFASAGLQVDWAQGEPVAGRPVFDEVMVRRVLEAWPGSQRWRQEYDQQPWPDDRPTRQTLRIEDLRDICQTRAIELSVLEDVDGFTYLIEGAAQGGTFALEVPDRVLQREGARDIAVLCANVCHVLRRGSDQGASWPTWARDECELQYRFDNTQTGLWP